MRKLFLAKGIAALLSAVVVIPSMGTLAGAAGVQSEPASGGTITYSFTGSDQSKAGYAEGSISLKADAAGTYKLYWADDTKALDGFYPIEEFSLKAGETKSVTMGYHTAIPAGATKIIAVTDSLYTADALTVYDIPAYKRLASVSGDLLYTFSTFSDVHIDKGSGWYVNAETNFKQGLAYSVKNDADYLVISGDCVTNDSGPDKEWDAYEKLLSKSDFVNPVWESDGNHDMRQDVNSGLKSFIKASGTDGSKSGKPFFYRVEETTGDLFIFMALELSKSVNQSEEFSDDQIQWVTNLIDQNYQSKNIFLIQHSPIKGFGAGDRMSKPYYSGLLNQKYESTQKFKALLETYPNIVFLSGHTHEDFVMDYNYSDENGTAAHMIHTPSLAGSTMPDSDDKGLERNNGKGFHSQAYFTEVYENEMVFYGVNILKELKYPKYSYIMEGSRTENSARNTVSQPRPLKNVTVSLTGELNKVSSILSTYYAYASYDSYQSLKKYYYQYKGQSQADESVVDEFEARITALSRYTGTIEYNTLYDTYYFVNNKDWSAVYAYAWDGSSKNAEWPGVKLSSSEKDENGKDIYKLSFSSAGEYSKVIFNVGSNSKQTVDIDLTKYKYNAFHISGTDNGKYTVSNFALHTSERTEMAMLYYITDEHGWTDIDTFMTQKDDGTYTCTYSQPHDKTFSLCLYDKTNSKYYSLAESQKLTFRAGDVHTFTLEKASSRGKSITFYGLGEDKFLDIAFNPVTCQISIDCRSASQPETLENISVLSAETIKYGGYLTVSCAASGGTGDYTYQVAIKKASRDNWTVQQDFSAETTVTLKPASAVDYDVRVIVRDSGGQTAEKMFTVKVYAALKNRSIVSDKIGLGEMIQVQSKASGGLGDYTYAVYYKQASQTSYKRVQNFSDNSYVTIKPTKAGEYDVKVTVRDGRGAVSASVFRVSVTVPKNTTTIAAETIKLGEKVRLNCSAAGGTGNYQFAVYYKKASSEKWSLRQAYSTNTKVGFAPASAVTYDICVKVRDSAGNIDKSYFTVKVVK